MKIKIYAPDYDIYFEPNHHLSFLLKMNKKLTSIYLKILLKPAIRLNNLNLTISKSISNILSKYENIEIINLNEIYKNRKIKFIKLKYNLPKFLLEILLNYNYYKKVYLAP